MGEGMGASLSGRLQSGTYVAAAATAMAWCACHHPHHVHGLHVTPFLLISDLTHATHSPTVLTRHTLISHSVCLTQKLIPLKMYATDVTHHISLKVKLHKLSHSTHSQGSLTARSLNSLSQLPQLMRGASGRSGGGGCASGRRRTSRTGIGSRRSSRRCVLMYVVTSLGCGY